jgi:hypothetical protein
MTPTDTAALAHLTDLALIAEANGQPGYSEEFDRAAAILRRLARDLDAAKAESGRLLAVIAAMRGAGGSPGAAVKLPGRAKGPKVPGARKDVGKARKRA